MSKAQELKTQCSMYVSAIINLMKDKPGYDEESILAILKNWVKVGGTYPYKGGDPKEGGRNYGPLMKQRLMQIKVTPKSEIYYTENNTEKLKASKYLWKQLMHLANSIYVDTGWGYLTFSQTEGAVFTMIYNFRVVLMKTDPEASRSFEAKLRTIRLDS